jgi:hypothetical protein
VIKSIFKWRIRLVQFFEVKRKEDKSVAKAAARSRVGSGNNLLEAAEAGAASTTASTSSLATNVSLRHFATFCDTLRHSATLFDTLRHFASLCDTFRHSATLCDTLRHFATLLMRYLRHFATFFNTLRYFATLWLGQYMLIFSQRVWLTLRNYSIIFYQIFRVFSKKQFRIFFFAIGVPQPI